MSSDTDANAFRINHPESPERGSTSGSDPPLSGPNTGGNASRRSSPRGKKSGKKRGSPSTTEATTSEASDLSAPSSPLPGTAVLVVETVALPAVTNEELKERVPVYVAPEATPCTEELPVPLPDVRTLEVKERRDLLRKAEEELFASSGKPLPTYTEEFEITQQELLAQEHPPRESTKYFYRSGLGLCKKEIVPFLLKPATYVANSKTFEMVDGSLVGHTRIAEVLAPGPKGFLTTNAHLAVLGEKTLQHFTALPIDDTDRKRYFSNLKVLNFMRATWDALIYSYQLVHETSRSQARRDRAPVWYVCSELRRELKRFKVRLLTSPLKTAKELKVLSGFARSWFFGGKKPTQPLLKSISTKYYSLIFSYLGRALPPPTISSVKEGYGLLVDRLTSTPPPEVASWRGFCKGYLEHFFVSPSEKVYPTDSSAGACLGYRRQDGGFSRAVQDLVGLGLTLMREQALDGDTIHHSSIEGFESEITIEVVLTKSTRRYVAPGHLVGVEEHRRMLQESFDNPGVSNTELAYDQNQDWQLSDLNDVARLGLVYQRALWRAVDWTYEQLKDRGIPFVAVGAPEAGLKTRYPTMAPVAVLLVSQLLRRAADLHLKKDPRARESLGGRPEIKLGRVPGPWYSQDLTAATDLHPFWLQRTFYEELLAHHPTLEKYGKWLPLLFGPRRLISPDDFRKAELEPPVNPFLKLLQQDWAGANPEGFVGRLGENGYLPEESILNPGALQRGWEEYWGNVYAIDSVQTSTGDPMGEAASFPLLPLVTIFSAERAGLPKVGTTGDDARLPLGQKDRPSVLDEPPETRSSKMNAYLETLDLNNLTPACKLGIHERSLEELGAVLSLGNEAEGKPNKIFLHDKYALYKEIPMVGDRALPFLPTKLLSAPPGGSKGSVSWFSQPTALRQCMQDFQFPNSLRLWQTLPFWNETLAAYSRGVPVREPVALGGINHPSYPHSAGVNPRTTQAWLSTLSQLTLVDWATGTGLSPLPSATPAESRKAASSWLKDIVSNDFLRSQGDQEYVRTVSTNPLDKDGRGLRPTLKESAEIATNASSSYLLYARGPVEHLRTPSVMAVSGKFLRSLGKGRKFLVRRTKAGEPLELTYSGTMRDVERKTRVYLTDPEVILPARTAPRSFGLEPSRMPTRAPWKWDWLERAVPTDDFVRAFMPTEHPMAEPEVARDLPP